MSDRPLHERLSEDLRSALKAGDRLRVDVIRMLISQLKNRRIEKGEDLSPEEEMAVLSRYAKQRVEAADQAGRGGREDHAEREMEEHRVVSGYLPEALGDEEIERIAREIIEGLEKPNLGALMKELMPRVRGRADGNRVREIATRLLGKG
jgi:uncharacterized protein YqeY